MSTEYNNFSVSEINFIETEGSDLGNTGVYTVNVIPDQGYSIDVSDFSVIAPFSPYVDQSSITLAQNISEIAISFNLVPGILMPGNDIEIPLCISGFATLDEFTIDGSYIYEATDFTPPADGTYSDGGEFNSTEPILSQTINAGPNKYFPTEPQAAVITGDNNSYNIQSSVVTDSDGDIISKTFNVDYTYPNQNVAGDVIKFVANAADKVDITPKINSFTLDGVSGYNQPDITNSGETKPLVLFGNEGATITSIELYDTSAPPQLIAGYGSNISMPASGSYTTNIAFPAASEGYSVPYRLIIESPDFNPNLLLPGATNVELNMGQQLGAIDFVFTPTTTNPNMTVSGGITASLNPDSSIDPSSGIFTPTFIVTPNAGYSLSKLTQNPATANDFNPTIPDGTGNVYSYTGGGTTIESDGTYRMPGTIDFTDTGLSGATHTLNVDAFVTTVADCTKYTVSVIQPSACDSYIIDNSAGTVNGQVSYVDCLGAAQVLDIGVGDTTDICAEATPTVLDGSPTVTASTACTFDVSYVNCCGDNITLTKALGTPDEEICVKDGTTPVKSLNGFGFVTQITPLETCACAFTPVQLGYSSTSYEDACCAIPTTYYIDGTNLLTSTNIYTDPNGTQAPDGYYAQ